MRAARILGIPFTEFELRDDRDYLTNLAFGVENVEAEHKAHLRNVYGADDGS